ncbi:MAG: ParA family protein [Myxacorys californica WJT36-NPBG1]|jgi:cellulose biosynthesis protein BcsQ|nr:ParA family protein [Myxacorys californica WJT36-NPBG1]
MAHIIATANMKGGVGKTTLTVNLATCLAKHHQKRVLIVDLDTQISATLSLMTPADFAKVRGDKRTLRNLVKRAILSDKELPTVVPEAIRAYISNVKGLDLLPGDIELYDEFLVSDMLHRTAVQTGVADFEQVWNDFEKNLIRKLLQPIVKDYDLIILDCAPGYNLITRSGLLASDFYFIPARPEPLSLIGIQLLERRISKLRELHRTEAGPLAIELLGIAFTLSGNLFSSRYHGQVMKRLNEDFSEAKLFKTRIPVDVNVARAVDAFTPVVLSNPGTAGAKAFSTLAEEFLQKLTAATKVERPENKYAFAALDD